jgi:hypothetical protein
MGARPKATEIRRAEKGSALLIVFVFAAIVAITLYMELPVAVFEAKRQKEQLLIDRGDEYAHAVKLFVRKMGRYPASIAQLENTNNMRFLRHRFKDPFTGKDDWRLLHAGPGGILLDSKVQPANPLASLPGQSSSNTASFSSNTASFSSNTTSFSQSSFGNSSPGQQSFGSDFGDSNSSSNSQPEVVVPPLPQRPPAVAVNGAAPQPGAVPGAPENTGDPTQSLVTADTGSREGSAPGASQTGSAETVANNAQSGNSPATLSAAPGSTALAAGSQLTASNPAQPNAGLMQNMVNSTGGPAVGAPNTLAGAMGMISGGGIAGVATKAAGPSIKIVNDQDDYSKWEFYYDPRKDIAPAGAIPAGMSNGSGTPQSTPNQGFGGSAFGNSSPSAFSSTPASTAPSPTPAAGSTVQQ